LVVSIQGLSTKNYQRAKLNHMSLMGVDIGTTGTKAVVFRENGDILSMAYCTYDEIFPRPGWVEMDPNQIWKAVCDVIRQASVEVKTDPVKAIGCSVLGEAVTPIDASYRPLYNTLPSVDARCKAQVDWWDKTIGADEIYAITGQPLHTSYSLNKIMWLRDEMPEVFKKTWKFLLWEDLFCCWLGLDPAIEYSLASRTMGFDIRKRQWSDHLLETARISPDLLAQPVQAGECIGTIPISKAKEFDLPPGVIITVAGHDVINGAFGAGAVNDGQAVLTIGTTESVVVALDRPSLSKDPHTEKFACYCHTAPEKYVALAYSTCSGNLLRWYRDNFARNEMEDAISQGTNVYDLLTAKANLGNSGLLLLPHFIGSGTPYLDPESRGALIGLNLATEGGDIIAAILEGTTFELKINLDSIEKTGVSINEMRAAGGGARSDRWLQLIADITRKMITRLEVTESGCLGAAIQAGIAAGVYTSYNEALIALIKLGTRFEPNLTISKKYDEFYEAYRQMYQQIKPLTKILSKYK
jgi:xylulokinase